MIGQIFAVAVRVLRQLANDKRFVALSLVTPVLVVYMLYLFFTSAETLFFDPTDFSVPAGSFLVHFITYVLCAIVLVRERTSHTLARMVVNGYAPGAIIGGYVAAYSVLATLQSALVLVALTVLFELDLEAVNFLMIYGVIWMLAIISIALGIFISNFARNEGQVFPFIPLIILPSVFFSGMILPVDRLPDWAGWLRFLTPMFYANESLLGMLGRSGHDAAVALALPVYGAAVLLLAMSTLKVQD